MDHLHSLEEKSIFLLREAVTLFKNPAALWSGGKDSTAVISLAQKAFFGDVPFPVIHIDNGQDYPETYSYLEKLSKEWNLNFISVKSEIKDDVSGIKCCGSNKTDALKRLMEEKGFDALIVSIRRDEHGIRGKERYFSPRDKEFRWDYKNQPAEIWNFTSKFEDTDHVRIHPILDWQEIDIWAYLQKESVPLNPLYFSKNGKRFRSLGCTECTVSIDSSASTVEEIIQELGTTKTSERAGRMQDKERENVMQRLRALGYM